MADTGPDTESAGAWLRRQVGVAAWVAKPSRLPSILMLWAATLYAWLRPGPRIPDSRSIIDWPDGYAGPVRDRTPEAMFAGMRNGFHLLAHWGPWKWWSPRQRAVTRLDDVHVPRKLRQHVRRANFRVTFDTAFDDVVRACAVPRRRLGVTWLMPDVRRLFTALHERGLAHSVEVWDETGRLVGGGFGVCAGPVFSGYSLFHTADNASKIAFVSLCHHLQAWGMEVIDHQRLATWAVDLGATCIPRAEFMEIVQRPAPPCAEPGKWTVQFTAEQSAAWEPRGARRLAS